MSSLYKPPRAKGVKVKPGSKCLICEFDKTLDHAHIVPDALLAPHPEIDKKRFRDQDGTNVFVLCPNCHRRYDRNLLSEEEMQILSPHIKRAVHDLNLHIMEILGARVEVSKHFFIRYQSFITSVISHVR